MLSFVSAAASGYPAFFAPEAGAARRAGAPDEVSSRQSLSEEEQRQVAELQKVDRKVRQHEQMHMAAGGGLVTSGPSYRYTRGPDGKSYAVGGEVGIDTSEASSPEATLGKARQIRAAALAPPDPSAQDRQVAALAAQMEMRALQELARQGQEAQPLQAGGLTQAGGHTQAGKEWLQKGLQAYQVQGESASGKKTGLSLYA